MGRSPVILRVTFSVLMAVGSVAALAAPALAHEGEESVPAITNVQEAIAIRAEHVGSFPPAEVAEHAMDKVGDALESEDSRGVQLALVQQAKDALEAGRNDDALTLLERSIGACPGAPVIEPQDASRTPPPLSLPCPSVAHIQTLDGSPVGGVQEPVLITIGAVLVLAGLGLARRIR